MVKNLPTVERSTKIRFGKNVPDSDVQAENTIIINASNTLVTTPNSGSIYMAPVRFRDDFADTNIVLMMYNRQTGELSESGESASNLVGGQTLQATTERGNATTGTVQFTSVSTSLVTGGKVGVSNLLPGHTLSVGSNVYIDDTGSNVLVISGGALLSGNLTVQGGVTSITTENLKIKDAIIELGQNNTSEDRTLDLGLIMTRPQSNVTIGFLETSKEIVMGFTESSADSNVITPLTSEDINVHVYGRLYTEANVGILNTDPMHTLDVGSNLYVDEFGSNILVVSGNTSISGDLTVDSGTIYVDSVDSKVGIKTLNPHAELHVVGNVYVSSNLTVDTETLHVDTTMRSIGVGTKNPTSNLHVVGNAYVSSNTTMGGTLTINHPTTAILTDLNSNVEIKLNQLANVVLGEKALANEDMLVYDGSNWRNQLQNHTFLNAKATEAIDKGDAVYASGVVGNDTFLIRKARANSSTTMPALGVAYQDFANNDIGLIVSFGRADGINTDNFLEGETVYVSNTVAGGLSNVQPYGATDLIQNVGLVVKGHTSTGIISVTGVGRANDIPNAPVVQDESDINYVYVNDENNDFKKIEPSNLLTQFQTFEQVSSAGNVVSNIMSFTNARTGLTVSSNLHVGSNISVTGLSDPNNRYLPMVKTDGFLEKSPVYVTGGGKYVIAASEAEFLGNITLSGNTTIINAGSVTISDRIFGLAANNSTSGLDSGIIIEHQEDGAFANVALIFHADEHRFSIGYTQNTFTDNHILHYQDPGGLIVDLRGNVLIQNSATLSSTLDVTGAVTFANDFTVGPASNLFVDVSTSRVGINEASPTVSLDVGGDARVQGTTTSSAKTNGALVVAGGVGITGPLFGAAATLDGVTTITNNTTSDAKGNGALVVAGGVGITGPLFGATATFDGDVSGLEGIFSGDLTVGGASNLFVDVSLSRVGINTATPQAGLHVVGNAYVSSNLQVSEYTKILDTTNATSKTTGALTVAGGLGVTMNIHGKNIFVEDIVSNSVVVLDTTNATSKTTGALIVTGGVGISKNIHALHANFEDVEADSVTVTDATEATSSTTGALKSAGGVGIAKDVYVGERAYVTGGLITNTGQVSRKTYSYSGNLATNVTAANGKITLTFTNHTFYAKIIAQLIESDAEVSTLILECAGGNWSGGTPITIAKGTHNMFGDTNNTNPWNATINFTANTVDFKPNTTMADDGHYNIFVEYTSQHADGKLSTLTEGTTERINWGY